VFGPSVSVYRALMAQTAMSPSPTVRTLVVGELVLDPLRRTVRLAATPLRLTRKEYDLLAYLAARSGRVVARRELAAEIWRQPVAAAVQTLDVHLCWLRRKLGESAARPNYLRTVRGVGVMIAPPA
jgi:DNA-binding response OmpR family regulator